jgi:hypothetical protein
MIFLSSRLPVIFVGANQGTENGRRYEQNHEP